MDIEYEEDTEIENFDSDNEEEEIIDDGQNEIENEENMVNRIYEPAINNFNYVYSFFKSKKILHSQIRCSICNEYMKNINDKSFLDNIRKASPKHDLKLSIRACSFIENIRINLIAVYFFLIDCFIINLS